MKTKLPVAFTAALTVLLSMTLTACGSSPGVGGGSKSNLEPEEPVMPQITYRLNLNEETSIDLGGGHRLYADIRSPDTYYFLPDVLDLARDESGKPRIGLTYDDTAGIFSLEAKVALTKDLARRLADTRTRYPSARILSALMIERFVRLEIKPNVSPARRKEIEEALGGTIITYYRGATAAPNDGLPLQTALSGEGAEIIRALMQTPGEANRELELVSCYQVSAGRPGSTGESESTLNRCVRFQDWDATVVSQSSQLVHRVE